MLQQIAVFVKFANLQNQQQITEGKPQHYLNRVVCVASVASARGWHKRGVVASRGWS